MDPRTAPPEPSPQDVVLRMLSGAWMTQAISAVVRFDLAERLANGPRRADELARECGALPDRLERLLRALASEGVFRRLPDGRWENTPASATLRSGVPHNLGPVARMTGAEHYFGWSRFADCLVRETTAFEAHYGEPVFDWYRRNEAEARNFNEAMKGYSAAQLPAIAAAYDPSACRRIVDVGGGHGGLLMALLAKAPHARGIVFDLEQGLAAAHAAGLGRDPRVELVAGNFFESVVPGGDLYVLKYILHDWDDDRCVTILRNIGKGVAPGGRVVVAEHLVAPHDGPDPAKWMDLHMMAMPGGRERTEAEYATLFARAGFRHGRTIPTACGMWLLEAVAS
jgi:O-methyltransferase domain